MIEGFKLKITSSELKTHCSERALYHKQRADDKEQELPGLKEALAKVEAVTGANLDPKNLAHMNKSAASYRMDVDEPVEALESDIKDHRNKALVFAFFSEHLFAEDYTLQEADLIRLEILKRW
jgi:hypothetical protein